MLLLLILMILKYFNDLSTFYIKEKTVFSNGPRSLPKNHPDCSISERRVFDDFILTDGPFKKALQSLKTCELVNNKQCGKLVFIIIGTTSHI